ncbi:MAG: family oxidoreductase [Herminiimonas sp.]|nr:family oxidoreductase [Herminiimonas sp.]
MADISRILRPGKREAAHRDAATMPPELWGGLECTVVRIGEEYRNQFIETGHQERAADIDRIAALGIRTLRYPIIWETVAPEIGGSCDWRWHDMRLALLRERGIEPIAGLVHHGSGPRHTNLLDPGFPELLAAYAAKVAERYPWITNFTPVNEPLTTARFSALYGHWYPHRRDMTGFLHAVYQQCRGIALAMRAIRRITPNARLVQTEDLGKTFSTPLLQYQADHENDRRWLSLDLLCGRVVPEHPFHQWFIDAGIGAELLREFVEAPCPPDIVGINHYLTSERYLDHRPEHYHAHHAAGNGRHVYADVEAVRIESLDGQTGPLARLREAWERYRLPVAVTEAHHGCSRDEQLRWLLEVWNAARTLKEDGADVRAVTVWSMLGAVDWNTLLVHANGFYEPGAFDVRSDPPRPTALAHAAAALASKGSFDHPVLDREGWWRRETRFYHPATGARTDQRGGKPRPLAITGATGTLGRAFSRICGVRGLDHVLLSRSEMDIADRSSIEAALRRHQPWAVINTAGYVRVAEASENADRCFRENAEGAGLLAEACNRLGIPFVTFSSDLVFNGELGRPYVESDPPSPACVYGQSKAEAERRVVAVHAGALIIRTSAFFGPWDEYNFVYAVLRDASDGKTISANDGVLVSPTYVPDLAHGVLDLLIDGETGIWHLANQGTLSWYELARHVVRATGLDQRLLLRSGGADEGQRKVTALASARGLILPPVENALGRFLQDTEMAYGVRSARISGQG